MDASRGGGLLSPALPPDRPRRDRPRASLHVGFLLNQYPVLSEVFIMNAAAALARKGVPLDIIPIWGAGGEQGHHQVEREIAASPLIKVITPSLIHHRWRRLLVAPAMMLSLLNRRGLSTLFRVVRICWKKRSTLVLAWAEALARSRCNLVHCQFATLAPLALELRDAGVIDCPIIVHFRGYDITRFVQERGADVYRDVFDRADWFIANCEAFRQRCVYLGCDPGRINVISSGTDLARFPLVERTAAGDGHVRLLAVGRLVEKKGFLVAVEAMRLVRGQGLAATLTIIGDGELRAPLEQAVRTAGLQDAVRLVGARPHQEVVEWLARSDILIAPSITASNGDSDAPVNTIKEAMATGMPVIGSRHGGIPELVEHGVNGLLCREGDPEDLARSIMQMAAMPGRWRTIGLAGRATIERSHSLELATAQYQAIYRRVGLSAGESDRQGEINGNSGDRG